MRIVVLDGCMANPGDLSWQPLHALGPVAIHDRTPEAEVAIRARDAEAVLTNKTPLRVATLARLPALRYIGVLATGYDVVDVEEASRRNILVTNVPEYSTNSVAQAVFALLFELTNRVALHNDAVRRGEWARSPDFSLPLQPTIELTGKTMGLVGYGRIGRRVAAIASALGMKVVVTGPHRPERLDEGIRWTSLEGVLRDSDVLSLHCPLRPETRGLINAARIATMKPDAILLNTARGALIDESDLADALNRGRIAAAALDVLTEEPPRRSSPLIGARHCLITPHIAWATREARRRLIATAASNLKAWIEGRPQNVLTGS